ncbi:MAG: TolC family protein [Spirochaetales bacterium]|nr:TolC family protein [Spirochaetales bacterium]
MKKKILLLLMMISTFALSAQTVLIDSKTASEEKPGLTELSLEQAIDMAVKNNLGLKSSSIDLKGKKWSVVSLFNSYYPTMNLSGSLISSLKKDDDLKGSATIPMMSIPGSNPVEINGMKIYDSIATTEYDTPRWNANLSFNLQWNFNAAMILSSYNTVLDYQSGKITYEDAVASLKKNVKTFYYMLALNKANFEIELKKLESKKDRYEQAQTKFKNGLTPKLDVLSTRVDYESYKPTLQTLGNTIVYYKNMLSYYIGEELGRGLVLTDTFIVDNKVVPDYEHAVKLFEKNNLTLKTLMIGRKQAKAALGIYIAQMTPSFSLGLSASSTVPDMTKQWFDNDENKLIDSGSLTLSLSLPLSQWLPFSSAQVGVIGAVNAAKKIDYNIDNYIKAQQIQIRKSIDDIRTAIENIKSVEMSVEMAQESYDETKKAYNLGTREILDVKDAENMLFNMKYQQLATEFSYRNSLLELESLLNSDISDILSVAEDNNKQNPRIK